MDTNAHPPPAQPHRISRKVHGVVDYATGLILIVAPKLFHFGDQNIAPAVSVVLGLMTILYSLLTDYELGVVRMIPTRAIGCSISWPVARCLEHSFILTSRRAEA